MTTSARKDAFRGVIGNLLRREHPNAAVLEMILKVGEQGCGDKVGVHDSRKHVGGVVRMAQLGAQGLVEGEGGCLCRAIIGMARQADKGGHRCNGYDMSFVGLDHGGQELLAGCPVAHGVDCEDFLQSLFRNVKDVSRHRNTSVVDEDGRAAKIAANVGSNVSYRRCRGDVALVVLDAGGIAAELLGQRLDVEDGDTNSLGTQLADNGQANAAAAASHDGNLFGPVPARRGSPAPRIGGHVAELAIDGAGQPQAEEDLEDRLGDSQVIVGRKRGALQRLRQDILGRAEDKSKQGA